ncbi:MAG TPA: MBL fold metallo-hydrolase, partial [Syntrophales bacterium]|nr:MBL fold metallo-hydrolase [Syntrophales bacterium]
EGGCVMMRENITWLGHSSIKIKGGQVVYIDPWKLKDGSEKADIILISHSHYDHYSPDDVKKIQKTETVIIAAADAAAGLTGDVRTAGPGDRFVVGDTEIETVPAYNRNKAFHPRENAWLGFVVTMEGQRIYYGGDTDLIPEMKDIRADIAILPVGGTYTMTAEEAAEAARIIGPKVAIPIHCGDLVGTMEDARRFRDACSVPVLIKNPVK